MPLKNSFLGSEKRERTDVALSLPSARKNVGENMGSS